MINFIYISHLYFDACGPEGSPHLDNIVNQLKTEVVSYYAVHLSLVLLLTRLSRDANLIKRLEDSIDNIFNIYGIDRNWFDEVSERVHSFYKPAIQEYL